MPFQAIGTGRKTVEMRLNDERRAAIRIGDEIEFENTATHQTLRCEVINLTPYRDFFELYANFDKLSIGYREDEIARPEDMYAYYSPEQIETYGALAIQIRLL